MGTPQYRTPEVESLYAELRGRDHPEQPFHDPFYSLGSYVPAVDLTLHVARWLAEEKIEAVEELWNHLNPDCEPSRTLLRKALRARRPLSIRLADWQWYELWAMHLLVLRMSYVRGTQDGALVLPKLAAIIVAMEPISLEPDGGQSLLRAARSEVFAETVDGKVQGRTEVALRSMSKAQSALGNAAPAVAALRSMPPMVRLVVHDYCTRDWGEGNLRYDLYYSERLYGCSHVQNKELVERLGFFEPWTDDTHPVPAAVTKDVLREVLAQHKVPTKKTETRDSLLEKAREIPGLLLGLIQKARPDRQQLRPAWRETVRDWSQRVSEVEAAAVGIVKHF